jgi:hypothetical protein
VAPYIYLAIKLCSYKGVFGVILMTREVTAGVDMDQWSHLEGNMQGIGVIQEGKIPPVSVFDGISIGGKKPWDSLKMGVAESGRCR